MVVGMKSNTHVHTPVITQKSLLVCDGSGSGSASAPASTMTSITRLQGVFGTRPWGVFGMTSSLLLVWWWVWIWNTYQWKIQCIFKDKHLRQMDNVWINAGKKISQTLPLGVCWWLDLLGSGCGSGLGCLSGCLSSCWSPPLGLWPFGFQPFPPPFNLSLSGKIVTSTVNTNNRMIMYTNANNCYLFFFQHKWKYNHKSNHYYKCWYGCSNTSCTSEMQNTNGNTYNNMIGTTMLQMQMLT